MHSVTCALCNMCSTEQATRKYLNSTCYFIGPLMVPAVNASVALGRMLNATVEVTQIQDPWGSGAILKAMQVSLQSKEILKGLVVLACMLGDTFVGGCLLCAEPCTPSLIFSRTAKCPTRSTQHRAYRAPMLAVVCPRRGINVSNLTNLV